MQVRLVRVLIETGRLRITGTLQLPTEGYRSRTTDFLNAHDTGFIALTDAEVAAREGATPLKHDFVAVGTRHIVGLMELEDLGISDEGDPPVQSVGASSAPPPAAEG
jgi:hypothetical protein